MLTKITVVPPPGAFWPSLEIPVLVPNASGVFAEKVEGLEPVQAEISTNGYNLQDGDFYIGSRVPKRNIVLHLILEARDNPISQVRRMLYGYFMPKMNVVLQFDFTDRDPVQIEGWVESFGGDRFSNDPDAPISIICPKPNFRSVAIQTINGISEVGTDPPLTDVLNTGDRMVGFQLRIVNNSGITFRGDIRIERFIEGSTPGVYFSTQKMRLNGVVLYDSSLGEFMWFETNQGKKAAEARDATDNDSLARRFLGGMTDDSSWPILWAAMNKFRVVTTNTTGWGTNHLNWTLKFAYEYGAV